jgi:hypothetical protein
MSRTQTQKSRPETAAKTAAPPASRLAEKSSLPDWLRAPIRKSSKEGVTALADSWKDYEDWRTEP